MFAVGTLTTAPGGDLDDREVGHRGLRVHPQVVGRDERRQRAGGGPPRSPPGPRARLAVAREDRAEQHEVGVDAVAEVGVAPPVRVAGRRLDDERQSAVHPEAVEAAVDVGRRVALLLVGGQAADPVAQEGVTRRGRGVGGTVQKAPRGVADASVEEWVVHRVHGDVRPLQPAPRPPALGVAGELVAVHGDVGQEAPRDAVERLGLGLLEGDVVAVEVGAGRVPAGVGLRSVRVDHRHDPEVDVGGQQPGVPRDVADQVEQRVLAGDLVAVLLRVEEHAPGRPLAARQVDDVERPPGDAPALDG